MPLGESVPNGTTTMQSAITKLSAEPIIVHLEKCYLCWNGHKILSRLVAKNFIAYFGREGGHTFSVDDPRRLLILRDIYLIDSVNSVLRLRFFNFFSKIYVLGSKFEYQKLCAELGEKS